MDDYIYTCWILIQLNHPNCIFFSGGKFPSRRSFRSVTTLGGGEVSVLENVWCLTS